MKLFLLTVTLIMAVNVNCRKRTKPPDKQNSTGAKASLPDPPLTANLITSDISTGPESSLNSTQILEPQPKDFQERKYMNELAKLGRGIKAVPWRDDHRCGRRYPAYNGKPGQCNPGAGNPCCSSHGRCGKTNHHCKCRGCVDYRDDACKNAGGHALVGSQCLTFNSEALSYTDAIQACEVKGHQLVSLAKPREVYDYVTTHYAAGKLFWVGASDARKEGSWEWYDGRPMATGEVPWNAGEPNNCCGGEDCLLMSAGVGYNDDGCTKKLPFICAIGCIISGQAYPHEAKIEQSCMELQCINGKWNYTGKINDECGECQVYGDPHVITFDYHSGERPWGYTFLGTGTYTVTQNGLGSQSDYGVISKFIDCELYGTYSCVNSATYYEPGIEIAMILPKSRCNVSEDPHCAMTVVVNGEVQPIGKSVHEFYGSGGTIFVFEYNPFYIHPQFHYCIHIAGTKGLSVRLCSNNGGHAHLYVWAMSSLKSKESQLYGMCGTYTETVTACYSHRDNICDKDTCEFVKSWVVDGEPNCGPDPLPPTLCITNTTTATYITSICSNLHRISCERKPLLCEEYKETCKFDLCRLLTIDAGKKRIVSCSNEALLIATGSCIAGGLGYSLLFGPFSSAYVVGCIAVAATGCSLLIPAEQECNPECQNGGYCSVASGCHCLRGWIGVACEKKVENVPWLENGRCGENYLLPNNRPALCNPASDAYCCSEDGECGNSDNHCKCSGCVNYRDACGLSTISVDRGIHSQRIAGGQKADPGEYPWQVSLLINFRNYGSVIDYFYPDQRPCGGSIINKRWILSAAHCFPKEETITGLRILLGAWDKNNPSKNIEYTQQDVADRVEPHHAHNIRRNHNDIAMIELKEDLKFTDHIRPVCLAEVTDFEAGKFAVATGWGVTSYEGTVLPDVLREVGVDTIDRNRCREMWEQLSNDIAELEHVTISEKMICTLKNTKDTCTGDSGGPLVVQRDDGRWVQIGIASFGYQCALPNAPGVFTDVATHKAWIDYRLDRGEA